MENVVLIVHLILALALIGVVLMQRSEGGLGGLGGGGGGGGGGLMSGRSAATALSKVTWGLAVAFLITSLALTVIAARSARTDSVIERLGTESPQPATAPSLPLPEALQGDDLTAPVPSTSDAPAAPPTPE